jgi:preprotein translocase subunit SecB
MAEEKIASGEANSPGFQPISLQPFAIQLQNVAPIEIIARRFPVDIKNDTQVNVQLNTIGLHVDPDNFRAQVIIELKTEPTEEPSSFEISFTMVGIFSYSSDYDTDTVIQFLQQGSISVLLPFARELLFSLCTRLQIPPVMLSLIQIATSPDVKDNTDKSSQ